MTRVLLVSTYELGHQPLGLATPAAELRARGHDVATLDLAVEMPLAEPFRRADLIAISVPMHTASRIALGLARQVRGLRPDAVIALYGLYAAPLDRHVRKGGLVDVTIGGEYEPELGALADQVHQHGPAAVREAAQSEGTPGVAALAFARDHHRLPDRAGLPPLSSYAGFDPGDGEIQPAGYVEASRGCAHLCRHCPITPVYGGRLRLVPKDLVLADIDQLVALGARHITFGDPDFLNAVPHSLGIVEAMRRRHPELSFDATIKVEHLIEHAAQLQRLREQGCAFIVSAFESLDDELLRRLDKGHTRADIEQGTALAAGAGIPLRPTWLPFTPWTSRRHFADLLEFIWSAGLVPAVPVVQLALRLLVPPGSPLVEPLQHDGYLAGFDADGLTHTWAHPDPAMDALQQRIAAIADDASGDPAGGNAVAFRAVMEATREIVPVSLAGDAALPARAPGLTEAWFCCAEPASGQLAPLEKALAI